MDIYDFFKPTPQKQKNTEILPSIVKEEIRNDERIEIHSVKNFLSLLGKKNFGSCEIQKAVIEGEIIEKKKFGSIIRHIYEFIGNADKIKETTILRMVDGKKTDKGYVYIAPINISYQQVSANRCLEEIFTQVIANDFSFTLEINNYPKKYFFYNEW